MKILTSLYVKSLLSVVAMIFVTSNAIAEIAVIVSANSEVSHLSSGEVKAIYLGKNKILKPVNQPEGSSIREEFLGKVVGKNESQFKAYWSKRIFSGKGSSPKVLDGDAVVRSQVAGSARAIGFIDASAVDESVKVIYRIK